MPKFPLWKDGVCGHCGARCGDAAKEDEQPYRLQCPTCYRDGCEECMPCGRGVECPDCEEAASEREDEP